MNTELLVVKPVTCRTVTRPRKDIDLPVGAVLRQVPDKDDQFTVQKPDTLANELVTIDREKNKTSIKRKPSVVVSREDYDRIIGRLKDAIARYTDLPVVRLKNMKVIRDLGPTATWEGADSPAWLHKINSEVVTHPSLVVEPFLKGSERHLGLVYHHHH